MVIRVLVIDDDHDLLHIVERYLGDKNRDIEIIATDSSEEALILLETHSFDAAVCDYFLGPDVMDGLDLLEWIRESGNQIPFIMFTGMSREEVAIKALNLGADFYLRKDHNDFENVFHELAFHIRRAVEKQEMECALRESEERFRAMFDEAPIGVAQVGLDNTILDANKALADMLGYSINDLIGMRVYDFTLPEDAKVEKTLAEKLHSGQSDAIQMEKRYFRSDNSIMWGRLSSSLVRDADGNPSYVIGMVEDVSSEKEAAKKLDESEKQFRTLFERANIGMTIVSLDDRLLDCNQALCDMLGYTKEEMSKMNVADFSHPEDMTKDFRLASETLANGGDFYQMYKRYVKKNGDIFWARLSWILIKGPDGEPRFGMGLVEPLAEDVEMPDSTIEFQK